MPPKRSPSNILPALARGKSLQAVHAYHHEDCLTVELCLEDGLALELTSQITHRTTTNLVQWKNGNSHALETKKDFEEG